MRPPVVVRREEVRRGQWTPEEDIILVSYIQEHGTGGWTHVPKNAGLQRSGKSCRLRWSNHLRPGIKRGNFTPEEDQIIIRHQALLGNRWAAIAAHLPSRTDNDIKNHWNIHLKKKLDKVGDERANNALAGNSVSAPPQNNQENQSVLLLASFEKWLLEDSLAPFPQILPEYPSAPFPAPAAPAPAPGTAPWREGHDQLPNMFTPFGLDQFSFGPFY